MNLKYLEEAKEKAIEEIINSDMTKMEKLEAITENSLWGYSSWINDEFIEWENDAKTISLTKSQEDFDSGRTSYLRDFVICDSIFSPSHDYSYEKYQLVKYTEALEYIFERYAEDFEEENGEEYNNEPIPVITTRDNPSIIIYKTSDEIIDAVYNFCIKNKIIGFKNDW